MKRIVTIILLVALILFTDQQAKAQKSSQPDEKQQVKSIYESTKTIKTAAEFTVMIKRCDEFLTGEVSEKNRQYITSLKGWALNRRGKLRLETAEQLIAVGNSQAETGFANAMADFDAAIESDPKRWRTWLARGVAFVSQKKFEQAVQDFSKGIELKADEARLWFNRAEARCQLGEFESALSDYDRVLKLQKDDWEALTGRGHCHFALTRFKLALKDYQRVSDALPENAEAWTNIGDAQYWLGQWQQAEQAYTQSINLNPSAISLQSFAWMKATCPDPVYRDPQGAKELIGQAIKLAGETSVNLDTLAAIQAASGEFENAKVTPGKSHSVGDS